jgi:hypothetical protein
MSDVIISEEFSVELVEVDFVAQGPAGPGGAVNGVIVGELLSADPDDPGLNSWILWGSDGTETGDPGDWVIKINQGGTIKTLILPFAVITP